MTSNNELTIQLVVAWIAGGMTVLLGPALGLDPLFMLALMIALPIALWWLHGMIGIFKHRPTPPSEH